jgi:hypothetical protein
MNSGCLTEVGGAHFHFPHHRPKLSSRCSGNSARSVAAEYLSQKFWPGKADWISAGTNVRRERPKEGVIRALREVSKIDIGENVRTRKLDELLSQPEEDSQPPSTGTIRGRLLAVILLCCNADLDCPHLDKSLPSGSFLIKEPVPGPMEMIQRSCGGPADDGGGKDAEAIERIYQEFTRSMEEFVLQRLPLLLPDLLGQCVAEVQEEPIVA